MARKCNRRVGQFSHQRREGFFADMPTFFKLWFAFVAVMALAIIIPTLVILWKFAMNFDGHVENLPVAIVAAAAVS